MKKNQTYPRHYRVAYFRHGVDTRDTFNEWYVTETTVNNQREDQLFYESLNHEANLVIHELTPKNYTK